MCRIVQRAGGRHFDNGTCVDSLLAGSLLSICLVSVWAWVMGIYLKSVFPFLVHKAILDHSLQDETKPDEVLQHFMELLFRNSYFPHCVYAVNVMSLTLAVSRYKSPVDLCCLLMQPKISADINELTQGTPVGEMSFLEVTDWFCFRL